MTEVNDPQNRLFKGEISRREFLARASALGIVAGISPTLLVSPAYAATAKKGGRLKLGLSGGNTSDSLDPRTLPDDVTSVLNWQLRNCLTEIDHQGNCIPELAESWEAMPGAAKWIFNLRKGVEFHNGKSLDAEDVIQSLNMHRGETKSIAKAYMRPVKDIKADGKHRVIITLEAGNADFPYFLADVHLSIQPAGTTDFNDGIGTGGYKLVRFEPGVESFAKRNLNYWKEGRAHFDEIEILCIADVNARTNALKTGQIDAMNNCDYKTVHLLEKDPKVQIVRITGAKHYTFPMHTQRAPFDNNDVRLGLKYAMNREEVLNKVLRGYGSIANDTPIGPTYQYLNKELPQRTYDPDKARYHMKKANALDHTFKLSASDAAFSGAVDAAILYQEHASKCGIKIEVVREPADGFWKNVWMKKDWAMSYWSGKPTEDWMFSQAYAVESKWNETFWTNESFNKLLKEARSELDIAKRREMYGEMQRILWAEGGTIIPMFADFVDAASSKVKYKDLAGNFGLDGRRCSERWWIAG